MPSTIWFTILRWLILGALAAAVVGVPMVYLNHRVDLAYKTGMFDGRAEITDQYAKEAIKQAEVAQARLKLEADRASSAEQQAQTQAAKAADSERKLRDLLKAGPSCPLPKPAVDILRDATHGIFSHPSERDTVSSPGDKRVPARS